MHRPLAIAIAAGITMSAQAQHVTIKSPKGAVETTISTDDAGHLVYTVTFAGKQVLAPSPIGVKIGETDLGAKVQLGNADQRDFESRFPWRGNYPEINVTAKAASIPVTQKGQTWTLEIKCFDNGVAYRSVIPGQGERKVTGEAAAWEFPAGTVAWCQGNTKNYEAIHQRLALPDIAEDKFKDGIGMPVTLELPDGNFAVLTEANLLGYTGMIVERVGGPNRLQADFRWDTEGLPLTGEIKTPWRVLMLSADLNGLVHNGIVPALCPPPDRELFPQGIRTEWLKPGRCLWQWWAYDDPGTHWSKQKWFVDKAAELNCQYYLVDEGWEHTRQQWASDGQDIWARMKELCDYAKTRNVGIWVWKGWTRNEKRQWPGLETPEKREAFFSKCEEVGIKGTKIDFMDSESHAILAFYEDCMRTAAKHKVMVNFHGAYKPTGEPRTWPNEMTREGVRGLEYNKWDANPPIHYATLPFTRYLAGHGDFTPTTFQPEKLKGTTFAMQLAGSVVFTSPILCWADKPDIYLESPAVEFIRNVPPIWDETIVLPMSKIGDLAAFARRSGDSWYVAVINGSKAREITIDFSFLGTGNFQADFFADVPNEPAKLDAQKNVKVNASTKQTVKLNDGGGFVAWIRK